jgi:hypothetical protein
VARTFATELEAWPGSEREIALDALDQAASWDAWYRLVHAQGRARAVAVEVVALGLAAIAGSRSG